ncbi:unnamed protein product [Cuscuta campestris]|uniref:mitogen-activated protein kinase kinase kinase n=1 Tax=Cuscuta campestris TaxID=132261 RepID=A0A484KT32_9ASTE|nr:unnamed protein product [Cuscuta campestris]
MFSKPQLPSLPPVSKPEQMKSRKEDQPLIRWRKGEMIGCGAFGRVYMGMNLDSGELIAVKEVSIPANTATREKKKDPIRELEEEVNLLKNLSHPNIVRYLGTAREEGSLNILLEFVPGGSISSLLGKFGSFPEPVIRMYTRQLLIGLEYLHKNGIMHRDIKGANILVDNKGCIKLADFGASKKVVELATMTGAKSMKGTPYWMAPEVILQTGHNFSADIWSVGCTVIEMATGRPPWSEQYQEVAALFHIGTTKSHPPIPEHLSAAAKDFLLKCLQKEPNLRSTASDLLQHPLVTGEYHESHPGSNNLSMNNAGNKMAAQKMDVKKLSNSDIIISCNGLKDVCEGDSVRCSTIYPEKFSATESLWKTSNSDDDDDMCQIDNDDDLLVSESMKYASKFPSYDLNKSFNPMCEPDGWECKYDGSSETETSPGVFLSSQANNELNNSAISFDKHNGFTFPCGQSVVEHDAESKIRAFLDEKVLDLKKLQTPLYEEFHNSMNTACTSSPSSNKENTPNNINLPPKGKSPKRFLSRRLSAAVDIAGNSSTVCSKRVSNVGCLREATQDVQSPGLCELKEVILDSESDPITPSDSEIRKRWEEELGEELERSREIMRQAGKLKTSSPKERAVNRFKDRLRIASPGW